MTRTLAPALALCLAASAAATQWPVPPGDSPAPPHDSLPAVTAGVGPITFDEAELPLLTPVDGLVLNTLNGAPLPAPISFTCELSGAPDPLCDVSFGPGTQLYVDPPGIEADIDSVLTVDFGLDVSEVGFDFAMACPPPASPGVFVETFDAGGAPVSTGSAEGISTGFTFAENRVIVSAGSFRSMRLSFSGDALCFAWFVDNLTYTAAPASQAIPTLGTWGLVTLLVLLAGSALILLPRRRRA